MAAIITEKFRQINAAQFEESFSETNENYYMFVGKSTPFTSGTSGGSDTSPPTPVDDITSENYRWDSMLGANAIAASDVTRGVPRRTYPSGTTYDMYEHTFLVTSQGSGYPDGTYYVKVAGDGSGAILKIVVSSNVITRFGETGVSSVQAGGSKYTFATVDLAGTNVYTDTGATSLISGSTLSTWNSATAGTITPIISPQVGHGHDAVEELGGHFVILNTKFEQEEGNDITVANDFRQVGIMKNPTQFNSSTLFTASTARNTYAVYIPSPSGDFDADEKITQASTGAVGRVVEWDATNKILYYQQERFTNYGVNTASNTVLFSGANAISGADSSATGTPSSTSSETVDSIAFSSGYANPEMHPDSGDIIYIENRRPISRASDQTEDVKIIVEF